VSPNNNDTRQKKKKSRRRSWPRNQGERVNAKGAEIKRRSVKTWLASAGGFKVRRVKTADDVAILGRKVNRKLEQKGRGRLGR